MPRTFRAAALLACLSALPLSAQKLAVAVNDGLPISTSTSGAAAWFAILASAPPTQALPILGVQFLIRPGGPVQNFALYDQDPASGKPLNLLASGSFPSVPHAVWQGGTFAQPVLILPGQTFFVAVDNNDRTWGNQLLPIAVGGVKQTHFWNTGWSGPFATQSWAYRLYIPGGAGTMAPYGTGSTGSAGPAALSGLGWPNTGNPVGLLARPIAAGAPGVLLLGRFLPGIPAGGLGTLYTFPILAALPVAADPASPFAHQELRLPNDPFLAGARIAAQYWFLDSAGPGGLVHTGGLDLVLGL